MAPNNYDEYGELKSGLLVVKWMCGFINMFLLAIIGGMVYAILQNHKLVLQNHKLDTKIVLLQDTVQDNGIAFIAARKDHDNGIVSLKKQFTELSILCCED